MNSMIISAAMPLDTGILISKLDCYCLLIFDIMCRAVQSNEVNVYRK